MEFTIQQALFGYEGGHQLLAASVKLPTEARHLLAVATDLSGSPPNSGFEQAYTGMPVPGTDYYALFSTWLAPEMPRPGCVWSHVLLIELADMARFTDLGELRNCFRRPLAPDDQQCRKALQFHQWRESAPAVAVGQKDESLQLLRALYASPSESIVIAAPDVDAYEDIVFSVWSQQWPRLRRNFRFSTGSFADRGRNSIPFDLQITPKANLRAWQRGGSGSEPKSLEKSPELLSESWTDPAIKDLIKPDESGFRSFLAAYGPDIANPRSAFIKLAATFARLRHDPAGSWNDTLRLVGRLFPNDSEAMLLKESVMKRKNFKVAAHEEDELNQILAVVTFFLSERSATAYGDLPLDYGKFVPVLWSRRRAEILSLLARMVRQPETAQAQAFATAIGNCVEAKDLQSICDQNPELVPFFIRHRLSLAFDPATWQLPVHIQWRVYENLVEMSLENRDWANIMAAMFLTATGVAVREVVEKAGPHAIDAAFRWLDDPISEELLPSHIWREALSYPAEGRLASPEPLPPDRLAFCAWLVPRKTARETISIERKDIKALADTPLDSIPRPLREHTAFLFVTLGLRAEGRNGASLIAKGFFFVHSALASTEYPPEPWALISPELPRSPRWSEWDRCEKLRRAVRKRLEAKAERKLLYAAASNKMERELVDSIFTEQSDDEPFID